MNWTTKNVFSKNVVIFSPSPKKEIFKYNVKQWVLYHKKSNVVTFISLKSNILYEHLMKFIDNTSDMSEGDILSLLEFEFLMNMLSNFNNYLRKILAMYLHILGFLIRLENRVNLVKIWNLVGEEKFFLKPI